MTGSEDIWGIERGYWLGGPEHDRQHLAEDAMMVFGQGAHGAFSQLHLGAKLDASSESCERGEREARQEGCAKRSLASHGRVS